MPNRKPILINQRFGRLVIIGDAPPKLNSKGYRIFRVRARCDCGNETIVYESKLRYGSTRSCGCLQIEISTANLPSGGHGHARHGHRTATYLAWREAWSRCTYRKHKSYKNYGLRGIAVCDRWRKFENFLADMGEKPKGLTLDRINNDGNYEPGNCRWTTWKVQANNRRPRRKRL